MTQIMLTCEPLIFFSKDDELLFFRWIKKIKSIVDINRSENKLYLYVKSDGVSDEDLNEFIALFRRYSFESSQLKVFVNEENKEFFPTVDGVGTENYYKVYPRRDMEKTTKDEINLKCTPLKFYTKNDENVMFGLINKSKCVTKCYGIGQILYLVVDLKKLSKKHSDNLTALFVRYGFKQKQLKKLKNDRKS